MAEAHSRATKRLEIRAHEATKRSGGTPLFQPVAPRDQMVHSLALGKSLKASPASVGLKRLKHVGMIGKLEATVGKTSSALG